jgi:hypothetical protein
VYQTTLGCETKNKQYKMKDRGRHASYLLPYNNHSNNEKHIKIANHYLQNYLMGVGCGTNTIALMEKHKDLQ